MKFYIIILFVVLLLPTGIFAQAEKRSAPEKANWRVDNNGYWKKMAEKGLSKLNPQAVAPAAKYTGSEIDALSTITLDSPDVPVTTENSTQSENSIFVHPGNPQNVLNSNNSCADPYPPFYGANDLYSFDGGLTWMGELQGAGTANSGDPAVVIGNNGWYYVNHIINNSLGQQVAYSTDQGGSWNVVVIDNGGSAYVLDKNHFWIDNNTSSPYDGHLYCAWTDFGGIYDSDIGLSYSSDGGLSWFTTVNISEDVNAGSHCQGVNINTGPNGEVYAVFAIYDGSADENAFGMARSFDGGATWEPATRIIENIRGIRYSGTSKNMRVNSFPVLAVDNSDGQYQGNLYLVWSNIGVPGVNTGNDIDVYMIRSEDQGATWSTPVRVNQDEAGLEHEHYLPWITCDPVTGTLSVVFYDDRNVGGNQCEVFCANSFDGGESWEDFKVSDVSFTPTPIPGLASGYMGDYLGISARGSYVYPCWTDTRTGSAMTYVSPYITNSLSRPYNLIATLEETTGAVDLEWEYDMAPGFSYFIVYRDDVEITQTTDTTYADQLPDYGIFQYKVTAFYEVEGESMPAVANLQWGNPHIFVDPNELEQTLQVDETAVQYLDIINTGELELHYDISTFILTDKDNGKGYCSGSGGCDEYIGNVQFGDIINTSSCGGYEDYTDLSTDITLGETIPITVINGNTWTGDVCGIWVDWNQNEDFTDDEPVNVNGGPETFTADITAPDNAVGGTTRMRIRIQYYGTPEPCGSTDYGEVEDYSINVISWLQINPSSGSVTAGDTAQVAVTFDAAGMEVGDYMAEFSISSDDPDQPQVIIPVTMHVVEYAVVASAEPEDVCLGDSVQLSCEAIGGSGSHSYFWTSDPSGFESTLQNPTVVPMENTLYYITASDGNYTAYDSIEVRVHDLPVVTLGQDTTICEGDVISLDAGAGYATYVWQDSSGMQTYTADTSGLYWVEVTNEYGCADRDTLLLTVEMPAEQPAMPAGPVLVDIYEGNLSLYVTTALPEGTEYSWEISPDSIADITSNNEEASIEWDTTFTGQAFLNVMAANYCGESPWSDSLEITVVNTIGAAELEQSLGFEVFPNPNNGLLTVKFSTQEKTTVTIYIVDARSAIVYKDEHIRLNGDFSGQIDLTHLPAGIYTLTVENASGRLSRKIIKE